MKKIQFFLCLFLASFIASAQTEYKKLKEFPTPAVKKITLDRLGDFYLTLENGTIRKYDPEGNFMVEFANAEKKELTLLEPWNLLRVFLYNRAKQEVLIMDRFLAVQEVVKIDSAWAFEPTLATPGTLNTIWILDKADMSIKLVNPKTKGVERESVLKIPTGEHEFIYFHEYQNLLFLLDKVDGITVVNTLGKPVRQVPIKGLSYMGFIGEEFYYLKDHNLKFLDIYTDEERNIAVDPLAKFVLVTDERMIVVKEGMVEVREFRLE